MDRPREKLCTGTISLQIVLYKEGAASSVLTHNKKRSDLFWKGLQVQLMII
jgi:hypothetical protein